MLQRALLQRVTRGSRTTPLQGRVCALYPVLGRKLWRSLRHMELLKYIGGSIFLVREILVSCFRHNRFYQDNPWILKWSYSLPASQRAKRCSRFWLLAHLFTWTRLDVGRSIVSFPISPMHGVDARSRFFRGGSCNEDTMRGRMLYVPPEGGQLFNHDRWSSFQAARAFWLPGAISS